jgi:hypothetical protein
VKTSNIIALSILLLLFFVCLSHINTKLRCCYAHNSTRRYKVQNLALKFILGYTTNLKREACAMLLKDVMENDR